MEQLHRLREVSVEALAAMGAPNTAYIKAVVHEDRIAYAIHGGDGTPLAVAETRELAFAVVRQHEMEPVDAH
ncbi:MAG TPA: DUF1150 family protein [Geminicoccaceae bacterium]|jgi:hypothetical protein|nr:DUF1150 family protein [Geminicoccaceae bacterium]